MKVNNLKELYSILEKKVQESLANEVANKAISTMQEIIKKYVYSQYKPTQYQRRYYRGGLIDRNNIHTRLMGNKLLVKNIRSDGGKDIARIVEEGVGYTWRNSHIYQMQPYPRPFTAITRETLRSGVARDAMIEGLKRRGLDARG